jgi:hypothetical protein
MKFLRERMKMHRRANASHGRTIQRALMLVGAIALVACGGDSSGTGPTGGQTFSSPVGSYDISTVNAKALPFTIASDTGGYKWEITSGSFGLTSDGKYTAKWTFRQTILGKVDLFTDSTAGTWTLSGTTVNFKNAQDATANDKAEWSNTGKLTFVETELSSTNTYVYLKK